MFFERLGAQSVSFVISLILARILLPQDYGVIALLQVFIAFANTIATTGLSSALIQKKDADNLDFSSAFILNILLSIFLYLIIWFIAPVIANFYNQDLICMMFRVFGLQIPIGAFNSIQRAYVSRNGLFKKFFFSTIIGTILSAFIGIIMAFKGFGAWSLVVQYLSNSIIDTIILWFTVKWRPKFQFSFPRIKKLYNFGWKILISNIINEIYQESRLLIIGKIYTPTDLAYFNKGQQFPKVFVNNLNAAFNGVLFPTIANVQDDKKMVKEMTRKSVKISFFLTLPIIVCLIIISRPLIELLLTSKWLGCVPYLITYCFCCVFIQLNVIKLQPIQSIGRSDIILKIQIIEKTFGMLVLLLTMKMGVMAMAISAIIANFFCYIIIGVYNKIIINYSFKEQIVDIIIPILFGIIMFVLIYPLNYLISSTIILLFIQIIFGFLIYFILSIIFKYDAFLYSKDMIRKIFKK